MMTQHRKPFDLEAFRDGAPHATRGGDQVQYVHYVTEVGFPDLQGDLRLFVYNCRIKSVFTYLPSGHYYAGNYVSNSDLVQVPFCIHDGTPLFYGDKLWSPSWGEVVVKSVVGRSVYCDGREVPIHIQTLQWEKPAPTRRVEAFDMPSPITIQPCTGAVYWTFCLDGAYFSARSRTWDDTSSDYALFSAGVIYPDKEAALAAGQAVLKAIATNVYKKED